MTGAEALRPPNILPNRKLNMKLLLYLNSFSDIIMRRIIRSNQICAGILFVLCGIIKEKTLNLLQMPLFNNAYLCYT